MYPHVEMDEESTDRLVSRFNKHVNAINAYHAGTVGMSRRLNMWHTAAARGLHKLLSERAVTGDGDEQAGNVALGAPHWLTFSDEQVKQQG